MKSKTEKTAIFGGSFDPPHYGHYDIVKNLEKSFDRVIVVPSYISPFKSGADDANARYKLCKKLFTSEKTEVSRREISAKGVSYSVNTAAYFAKKYVGTELYWVVGSEELKRLCEWHDIDRLKTLVRFLVVPRVGYPVDAELLRVLKKRKIKIKFAKFDGLDISSTRIKIDRAFGKSNSVMPYAVDKLARDGGLFDPYGKYVDALYAYKLKERRIEHTYRVAVRGAELAKLYGANVHDAVVACILHDIAKSVDPDEYKGKVDVSGFPPPCVHAPIGAYIAKREFGVSDEIARSIYVHSTGDGEMSLLDEIVYLADKTECGRKYDSLRYLTYLCSVDREYAMYYALNEINGLKESVYNEHSEKAREHYARLCKGRKQPEMVCEERKPLPKRLPATRASAALGEVKSKAIRAVPEKLPNGEIVFIKPKDAAKAHANMDPIKQMADAVAAELSARKAHDIAVIDLAGKTIIADYFVIASASSSTAVKALYGYVEDIMTKKFGLDPNKRDIDREWVALDYGGIIVHIFTDKTREFYNIERLWSDGSNIRRIGD
ncbi:MAG: nicotinate (nicotinamide) nucleotide adenylyltransferase [Roseburia sp.]|nr:nicotinate (nicotinamide) nucleotide adenylyltransferase [Roseburia sp.]